MPLLPAPTSLPTLLLLLHLLYRAAEPVRLNVRTAAGPIGAVEVQTFEELDTLLPKFLLESGIPQDELEDYHESLRSSVIQDRVFPAAMVPLICKGQDALVEVGPLRLINCILLHTRMQQHHHALNPSSVPYSSASLRPPMLYRSMPTSVQMR